MLLLWICLLFVFVLAIVSCLFLAAMWSPFGKECSFGSPVCDVFVCVCFFFHFSIWCPGSGEVLDCIDS